VKLVYVSSALALATVCLAAGQGADRSSPVEDQEAVATEERLAKPSKIYFEALDTARKDYRNSVGAALAEAEKIEMYLLDFEMEKEPESDFLFWENRLPKELLPNHTIQIKIQDSSLQVALAGRDAEVNSDASSYVKARRAKRSSVSLPNSRDPRMEGRGDSPSVEHMLALWELHGRLPRWRKFCHDYRAGTEERV